MEKIMKAIIFTACLTIICILMIGVATAQTKTQFHTTMTTNYTRVIPYSPGYTESCQDVIDLLMTYSIGEAVQMGFRVDRISSSELLTWNPEEDPRTDFYHKAECTESQVVE